MIIADVNAVRYSDVRCTLLLASMWALPPPVARFVVRRLPLFTA